MLFKSRTGAAITGDESAAFSGNFATLPDNTQAPAMIKSFTVKEYDGETYFQLIWKLVDGDFKNAEVKQRITPFDVDDNRAQRNMNMLYRIFGLLNHKTDYIELPTDSDLAVMRGQVLDIKIGNGYIQGENRTWVREVWKSGELEVCTGETKVVTSKPSGEPVREESMLEREARRKADASTTGRDDGIPF